MPGAQKFVPETQMEQFPPSTTETTLGELKKYRLQAGFPYEFEAPDHSSALQEVARYLKLNYPLQFASFRAAGELVYSA